MTRRDLYSVQQQGVGLMMVVVEGKSRQHKFEYNVGAVGCQRNRC